MRFQKPATPQSIIVLLGLLISTSCDNTSGLKSSSSKSDFFVSSKINITDVSTQLKSQLDAIQVDSNSKQAAGWLKQAYENNNYQPYWLAKGGVEEYAREYFSLLDSLQFDGLKPLNYNGDSLQKIANDIESETIKEHGVIAAFEMAMTKSFIDATHDLMIGKDYLRQENKEWKIKNDTSFNAATLLQKIISGNDFKKSFDSLRPNHAWYVKFRNEYIRLHTLSGKGGWTNVSDLEDSIEIGFQSKQIPALRVRLHQEIGQPIDTLSDIWNEDLATSLKKYQFQHQLKQTGLVDSSTLKILNKGVGEKLKTLALNMERLRWMGQNFPQPYIWVDIPKMELDYVDNDSIKFNMRVVVGRKGRPTPALKSKIENIVLSPPWTVPPTIMKEEVVPGLARRGGSYLARRGLKAYRGGRPVNPAIINSKNYKQFAISQAPGYRSSLGEVKFNMINPWAIYLHDTPHREDFVKSFRAYSSGCIRVHKPKQFAEFLLQDTVKYSYAKIDSICKKRTTIFVPFTRKVDVHIVYLTNAIDSSGNVMFLKDVYGWDG